MSDIPQLIAAIDSRLANLAGEITVLKTAKEALEGPRTSGRLPASATGAVTARGRRHPKRPRRTPTPTGPTASGTTPEPPISPDDDGRTTTPHRSRAKAVAKATRPRRAGVALGSETLERLLADSTAGLSAIAIAQQAGAGDSTTLKLLRELEAAGDVRPVGIAPINRVAADYRRGAHRRARRGA